MPRQNQALTSGAPRPEIIVDFVCDQGLLFLQLKNIGARSGYKVTATFDKPLYALEGKKCISDLQLFRRLEFIPPGKEFLQLIDPMNVWFTRRQPSRVTIDVNYRDREGNRFDDRIVHDLRIYRDLGYVNRVSPGGTNAQRKP